MNVNLRQIKAFVAIARLGSFTRAASHLHLSQPALTVQMRQLEDALGVRLLDRNTRSVKLTQIGRELAPSLERVLHEIDAVMINTRELAARSRGVVTVAALPSICTTILPAAIARFKERYPGISIRLKDSVAQRVLAWVKAEEVDFGIGSFGRIGAEFQLTPLLADRMSAFFPAGHPLAAKKAVAPTDLLHHPLILMEPDSSVRQLVDRAYEAIGRPVLPAYEATYMSTAIGMVQAGLGITILPTSALELGKLTDLASRPIKHPGFIREIGVLQKTGRSLSPAAESFLKVLTAVCKSTRG